MGWKSYRPIVGADAFFGRGFLGSRFNFLLRIQILKVSHGKLRLSRATLGGRQLQVHVSIYGAGSRRVARLDAIPPIRHAASARAALSARMHDGRSAQAANVHFLRRWVEKTAPQLVARPCPQSSAHLSIRDTFEHSSHYRCPLPMSAWRGEQLEACLSVAYFNSKRPIGCFCSQTRKVRRNRV